MQNSQELLADAIRLRDENNVNEAALAFTKVVQEFKNATDPAVRENVAEALLNIGVLLNLTGYTEAAITVFDRVIKEHQSFPVFYISALYNKAGSLMRLARPSDAITTYEEMVKQADSYRGDDPMVLNCVAGALMNLGVMYGRSDALEKATAAFDEVVRRFAKHSNPRLQNSAAQALYNKAMVLRNAGRGADAIAGYTDIVDQFAAAPAEELRHWAGMAQYNKTMHLARLGDVEGSVRAAEEMAQRFATSTDPAIRVGLAKALYSRVLLIREAGYATESVQGCWDIQARFKDDADPEIQSVVAAARRFDRLLVALADPTFDAATGAIELDPTVRLALDGEAGEYVAGVINVIMDGENPSGAGPQPLKLPEVLQILQTEEETPPAEDREAEELSVKRRLLRQQLQRDLEGHVQCGEILAAYLDRSEPFGLFLRNFDIEGYMSRGSGAPEPIRVSVQFSDQGLLEEQVAAEIGTKLPFMGVGNNMPVRPDFKQRLPRILLSNEHWQEVVEELIGAASIIVMDIVRLTPGVRWELSTVERLGKQDQTVVILSTPRREESVREVAASLYGMKLTEDPVGGPTDAEFRAFKRVIRESELPENMADAPLILDLISDIERIQHTQPAERSRWDRIEF